MKSLVASKDDTTVDTPTSRTRTTTIVHSVVIYMDIPGEELNPNPQKPPLMFSRLSWNLPKSDEYFISKKETDFHYSPVSLGMSPLECTSTRAMQSHLGGGGGCRGGAKGRSDDDFIEFLSLFRAPTDSVCSFFVRNFHQPHSTPTTETHFQFASVIRICVCVPRWALLSRSNSHPHVNNKDFIIFLSRNLSHSE